MFEAKRLAELLLAELRELRSELRLLREAIGCEKTTTGGE